MPKQTISFSLMNDRRRIRNWFCGQWCNSAQDVKVLRSSLNLNKPNLLTNRYTIIRCASNRPISLLLRRWICNRNDLSRWRRRDNGSVRNLHSTSATWALGCALTFEKVVVHFFPHPCNDANEPKPKPEVKREEEEEEEDQHGIKKRKEKRSTRFAQDWGTHLQRWRWWQRIDSFPSFLFLLAP